jgi:hypothetical protein
MKIINLILSLSLTVAVFSQTCGDLYLNELIPTMPDDTSETFLRFGIYCNENAYLDSYQVTVVSNSVTVDAYYCYGWLQVITQTDDTVSLGVLQSGQYSYVLNTYTSYSPDTGCLSYLPHDNSSGSFSVLPTNATSSVNVLTPVQKQVLKMFDSMGREVSKEFRGLKFIVYSDGSVERIAN